MRILRLAFRLLKESAPSSNGCALSRDAELPYGQLPRKGELLRREEPDA